MLGHDTEFGQIECLKLITSQNYSDKKVGYLGLTQLFNEKSEVLMMATHRMRSDLQSSTHYVVALALASLSEITTADMCRELAPEVCKLMVSGNNYIKKKAALAATRIIRRVPELMDEFIDKIPRLMEERHHGVLLSTITLIVDILQLNISHKDKFKKYVPFLVKVLKNLVTSYSAEFDISGIIDPFLQIEILRFFRLMGEGDDAISEEINDILTQVATNTPANKNTGNAVLFECVKTIMAIESSNTLKTLAINILGKFLSSKESNSRNLRYVALQSLQKVVRFDLQSVQKHKAIILECLRENDMSIKKLALDVLYLITNEKNIESIVKEMLNYILEAEPEFLQDLTLKICSSVEKYSPDRRWHIDTIIKVLTLAGNYVKDESIYSLLHLIAATPQLQNYAVHKIFFSLRENITQDGLCKVGLWCIGEFGQLIISGKAVAPDNTPIQISEEEVINLIERILKRFGLSELVKEYTLTCLIKLYTKFNRTKDKIRELIDSQTTSPSLEVQQRACEYLQLLDGDWDAIRGAILESIPVAKSATTEFDNKPVGDTTIWEVPPTTEGKVDTGYKPNVVPGGDLLEIDLVGGSQQSGPSTQTSTPVSTGGANLDLLDIFGTTPQQNTQPVNNNSTPNILNLYGTGPTNTNVGGDLLGGISFGSQPQPMNTGLNMGTMGVSPNLGMGLDLQFTGSTQQQNNNALKIKAIDEANIEIIFECTKENFDTSNITTLFNNKSSSPITNLVFQIAVQKHCKLTMNPISSSTIPANSNGAVTQTMKIQNSQQGKKAIAMKVKVSYDLAGKSFTHDAVVSSFPITF